MAKNYFMVRTRIKELEFAQRGIIAVGWRDINFSNYIGRVDELMAKVDQTYNASPRSLGRGKGEIKRFMNIKSGDVIVTPCYRGFLISIATGEHRYDKSAYDDDLPNQICVDFVKTEQGKPKVFMREGKNLALVSKLQVPGFAILSIVGKSMTDEIDRLIMSKEDLSGSSMVQERENQELSRFKHSLQNVLKDYEKSFLSSGGNGFEKLLVSLFKTDGYEAKRLSKRSGKGKADADILAIKKSTLSDELTTVYYIQAKHHTGITDPNGLNQLIEFRKEIEQEAVHEFKTSEGSYTSNSKNIRYILISSGSFSPEVMGRAEEEGITLIDGNQLSEMLFSKIDEMDEVRYGLGFYMKYEHVMQE